MNKKTISSLLAVLLCCLLPSVALSRHAVSDGLVDAMTGASEQAEEKQQPVNGTGNLQKGDYGYL